MTSTKFNQNYLKTSINNQPAPKYMNKSTKQITKVKSEVKVVKNGFVKFLNSLGTRCFETSTTVVLSTLKNSEIGNNHTDIFSKTFINECNT